jgi:hypothetical protein
MLSVLAPFPRPHPKVCAKNLYNICPNQISAEAIINNSAHSNQSFFSEKSFFFKWFLKIDKKMATYFWNCLAKCLFKSLSKFHLKVSYHARRKESNFAVLCDFNFQFCWLATVDIIAKRVSKFLPKKFFEINPLVNEVSTLCTTLHLHANRLNKLEYLFLPVLSKLV